MSSNDQNNGSPQSKSTLIIPSDQQLLALQRCENDIMRTGCSLTSALAQMLGYAFTGSLALGADEKELHDRLFDLARSFEIL